MNKYIDAELLKAEIEKNTPDRLQLLVYRDIILALIDYLQQEQPEVDLEKEIAEYWSTMGWNKVMELRKFKPIARYFYGLGQLNSK